MKQVVLVVLSSTDAFYKIYDTQADYLAAISEQAGFAVSDMETATLYRQFLSDSLTDGEVFYRETVTSRTRLLRLKLDGDGSPSSVAQDLGELAHRALRDLAQTPEPPSPDIVILTDSNGWPSGVFTFGDNARPLRYVLVSENDVRDGAVPASEAHVATVDGHFKDFAAVEAEIHSRI